MSPNRKTAILYGRPFCSFTKGAFMPVRIPDDLPAVGILEKERVAIIPESRAFRQDIRPLRIAILNLMPRKTNTETQLLRLLGHSPLQVSVTFLRTRSYTPTHTPPEHLEKFYTTFDAVKGERFDGLIITGAPVETLEFERVAYWTELVEILDWSKTNVYSSLHICWGAQAALYHHYRIAKQIYPEKIFGVYPHRAVGQSELLHGHDDRFFAPHSRHAGAYPNELLEQGVRILAFSDDAGVYLAANYDERQVFVFGHPEYDRVTLYEEYTRDLEARLPIRLPEGYFPGDDPTGHPAHNWRGHAHLLFGNWLNLIYQRVPYDLATLREVYTGKDCAVCGTFMPAGKHHKHLRRHCEPCGKETEWSTPFFGFPFSCVDPEHPRPKPTKWKL
jgi:homoserine O-succinyltransferase